MGIITWIKQWLSPVRESARPEPAREPSPVRIKSSRAREQHLPTEPQGGFSVDVDGVRSFTDLPTRIIKIVGMGNYCSENYRRTANTRSVVIVAEPSNPVDPKAVTVGTVDGEKLGYMASGTAHQYHNLMVNIGPVLVSCKPEGMKWWMEVPTVPSLRKVAPSKTDSP